MKQGPSGVGQKREAEEPPAVPTLGLVAEEERFAPLRELIQPVRLTPVNELGEGVSPANPVLTALARRLGNCAACHETGAGSP